MDDLSDLGEPFTTYLQFLRLTDPDKAKALEEGIRRSRAEANEAARAEVVLRATLASFATDVRRDREMDWHLRATLGESASVHPTYAKARYLIARARGAKDSDIESAGGVEEWFSKQLFGEMGKSTPRPDPGYRDEVKRDIIALQDAVVLAHEASHPIP